MKYFSMLIKPASSLCNMKCKYCFYHDIANHREVSSYGVMSHETIQSIVSKTIGYFDEPASITYAFQGGEPTVAGIAYFHKFVEGVNRSKKEFHEIHYAIQTNGTLVDEEWIEFFRANHFLVGLSLDGMMDNHDRLREDNVGNGTFQRVISTYKKLVDAKVNVNILTVLTNILAERPKELYRFYQRYDIRFIQLIPCMSDLNCDSEFQLSKDKFSSFYKEFFDEWIKELKTGVYRSVSFFDNIIHLFAGKMPLQCGYLGFCSMQFVVESNGDIYPCDFYVFDRYLVGNINENTIVELAKSKIVQTFKDEERVLCKLCNTCKFKNMCNGNCKKLSSAYYDLNYCGLKDFYETKENELISLAKHVDQ